MGEVTPGGVDGEHRPRPSRPRSLPRPLRGPFPAEAASAARPRGLISTRRAHRPAERRTRRSRPCPTVGLREDDALDEWSRRHPSRFAWLSIDRYDNDLGRLMSYTAAALDRVDPIGSDMLRPGGRPSVAAFASRLATAMSGMKGPRPRPGPRRGAPERRVQRHDRRARTPPPSGSRLALDHGANHSLPMARLPLAATSSRSVSTIS